MTRSAALITVSVAVGTAAGGLAAAGLGPFFSFGLIAGSVTGAVVAPLWILTLLRKPLWVAVLFVAVPTLGVAAAGGLVENPPLAWLLSVATVVIQCLCARALLPDDAPVGRCHQCGYDLKGLSGAPCPECGAQQSAAPRRRGWSRPALVLQVAGLALVLTALGLAINYRRTPADTASLVKRLGAYDIELAGNAQRALMKQDPGALIQALSNPDPYVRGRAVQAVGWLRDVSALPQVEALRNDPDQWVRRRADEAARLLGGK